MKRLNLKEVASDSMARYKKELTGLQGQEESIEQLEKLRGFIGKVVSLPLHYLTPGENVRQNINEEEPKFLALVESIREEGLLQNLVARLVEFENGSWELRINAGERRYRACKRAGIEKAPVLIKPWVSGIEEVYTGISENEDRVNLSPLDLAEAYARLIKLGVGIEEIAERRGRDKRTIRKYISLSELPADVRKILRERPDVFTTGVLFNEIASRKFNSEKELNDHIQTLIKDAENSFPPVSNSDGVVEKAAIQTGGNKNEDNLEGREVQGVKIAHQTRRNRYIDPELIEQVVGRISGAIPVKVKVKGTRDKGRITINYVSQEQLELLLSRFPESGIHDDSV